MPTHKPDPDREPVSEHGEDSTTAGYEKSDVNVHGLIIFVASLAIFLVVFFVFCFGMGKVINNEIEKHDGPETKWNQTTDLKGVKGNMLTPNTVMEQQKLSQMTQNFPSPRLQTDDGNQEIADMHAREDLLLEHYSWVDKGQGKVRIPIERAMELIAQRGLPVAPGAANEVQLTGEEKPVVTQPLTDGFARTGYEQEAMETQQQQLEHKAPNGDHAALTNPR